MAQSVLMKSRSSGLVKPGYIGFSWTYLFFGFWVPLFRGELGVALLHLIFTLITGGLWQIVFAFIYNRQYMSRLLDQGYVFADSPDRNRHAAARLGVDLAAQQGPSSKY